MNSEDIIARHQIMNALANHSRGVDRADESLLASAYHADASVDYGFFQGPAADLVAMLAAAQKVSAPTLHRTSNIDIRVRGARAISESYVVAYVEEETLQRFVLGRYLDRHERKDGAWKLSHRFYVLDGNIQRPNTARRGDPSVALDHYAPSGAKGGADSGRALLAHHYASFQSAAGASAMAADPSALDAALSREAIRRLINGYCRGVDRADEDMLRAIFWEDSTVVSGIANGTGAEFARAIVAYVRGELEYCFHSVANEWIEVKGDHAVGEHYALASMASGAEETLTGGRYIDAYERRGGEWRIKSRTFVADWTSTQATSLQKDGFYAALKNRGAFGKSDPIYAHWASLD